MKSLRFCTLQAIFINIIIDVLLVQGKYKRFTLSSGNKEGWCVFIFPSIPSPDLCLGKLNLKHIKTHRKLEFFYHVNIHITALHSQMQGYVQVEIGFRFFSSSNTTDKRQENEDFLYCWTGYFSTKLDGEICGSHGGEYEDLNFRLDIVHQFHRNQLRLSPTRYISKTTVTLVPAV